MSNVKKKLLITLGCSYTEGVGCWLKETPEGLEQKLASDEWMYWFEKSRDNFHQKGWPKQLGKMMGFDSVLNLGMSGASASSNVKFWFERYSKNFFNEYDATLVWFLPSPYRISFYKSGLLEDELISSGDNNEAIKSWLLNSNNSRLDSQLEQASWIRIMINECEFKNINLVIFHQSTDSSSYLSKFVTERIFDSELIRLSLIEKYQNKICGHLNEDGYYELANIMYNYISKVRPDIELGEPKNDIECVWRAERYQYDSKGRPIVPNENTKGLL